MKIRYLLYGLTLILVLFLAGAVYALLEQQLRHLAQVRQLSASNQVRASLLVLEGLLFQERRLTYSAIASETSLQDLAVARAAADDAWNRTSQVLASQTRLVGTGRATARLNTGRDAAAFARRKADAIIESSTRGPGDYRDLLEQMSEVTEDLQGIRLMLRTQEGNEAGLGRSYAMLRYYSSLLTDSLSRNQAFLIMQSLMPAEAAAEVVDGVQTQSVRARFAMELLSAQASETGDPYLEDAVSHLEAKFLRDLAPYEERLLEGDRGAIAAWLDRSDELLWAVQAFQQDIIDLSQVRLELELSGSLRTIVAWAVVLTLGLFCVIAIFQIIGFRVVRPLENLIRTMLLLADDHLEADVPRLKRRDEIGAMSMALRVFKANAIRRVRLQQNRNALHERLKDAYRSMRRDLNAAATVQKAMLPPPLKHDKIHFESLFLPSAVIAGDTFSVVDTGEGRVGFFVVDVAGHGPPAALGSAAAHSVLSQGLLRGGRAPLQLIVKRLNSQWSEDLPYLTMVVGEINPDLNEVRFVQAGHPPPILLHAGGTASTLGDGGLPIGVFEDSDHDEYTARLQKGDRLIIYSDGVLEAENDREEAFGEARLLEFLKTNGDLNCKELLEKLDRTIVQWRGGRQLEDDLTVVVLEYS